MRQLLDGLLQLRVALPDNLIQLHSPHSRFLKLREWAACFDGFMLARVAYQKNAVIRMEPFNELVHLASGGERRFVEHIQSLLAGVRLLSSGKMTLKR